MQTCSSKCNLSTFEAAGFGGVAQQTIENWIEKSALPFQWGQRQSRA